MDFIVQLANFGVERNTNSSHFDLCMGSVLDRLMTLHAKFAPEGAPPGISPKGLAFPWYVVSRYVTSTPVAGTKTEHSVQGCDVREICKTFNRTYALGSDRAIGLMRARL